MFCIVCHQSYPDGAAHYCTTWAHTSAEERKLGYLTEADVRRILREELESWWTGHGKTSRQP